MEPEETPDITLTTIVQKRFSRSEEFHVKTNHDYQPISHPKDNSLPDVSLQIIDAKPRVRRKRTLFGRRKQPTCIYRVYGMIQIYGLVKTETPLLVVLELFGTDKQTEFQIICERLKTDLGLDINIVPSNSEVYRS